MFSYTLLSFLSYLLSDGAHVRTTDPKYMSRVDKYFSRLLPLVNSLQIINGGPIIMTQVLIILVWIVKS